MNQIAGCWSESGAMIPRIVPSVIVRANSPDSEVCCSPSYCNPTSALQGVAMPVNCARPIHVPTGLFELHR